MRKLCGAKSRRNENRPCRGIAMANGRCRMHGGKSTGRKTEEGKRNHALAVTTTGLHTNKAIEDKRQARKMINDTKLLLNSLQKEGSQHVSDRKK